MMNERRRRRRRLLALIGTLALACLVSAVTYLCTSFIVRGRQQSNGQRVLLGTSSSNPAVEHKRVRTHKVIFSSDETVQNNDGISVDIVHNSSSESGGIITTDSQGLLVEIASPHLPIVDDEQQTINNNIHQQTKIINGINYSREEHPYIVRIHWTDPIWRKELAANLGVHL